MMNFISNRLRQILTVVSCSALICVLSVSGNCLAILKARALEPEPTNDTPRSLPGEPSSPIRVVASLHPYALLAREIGSEAVAVITLIPEGVDPHELEPTPSMLRLGSHADLIFLNGAGLDGWVQRGADTKQLLIAEDIAVARKLGESVPGVAWWLDREVAVALAGELAERLCLLREVSCPLFRARAATFATELRTVSLESPQSASHPHRHILSFHKIWGRLAARLGFTEIGGFAECENKARTWGLLREARQIIEREKLRHIIIEPFHQGSADLEQVARELGVTPLPLDSQGWRAENYRAFFGDVVAGIRRAGGGI